MAEGLVCPKEGCFVACVVVGLGVVVLLGVDVLGVVDAVLGGIVAVASVVVVGFVASVVAVCVAFGVVCMGLLGMAWVGTTLIGVPNMAVWENPVGTCLDNWGTCTADIVAMVVGVEFAVGMWVGIYVGKGFAFVAWWWVVGLVHMPVGLSPEMSFVGTCCYRTEALLATMVAVHAVFVRLEHVPGIVWAGTVPVIVKVVGGCTVFPP